MPTSDSGGALTRIPHWAQARPRTALALVACLTLVGAAGLPRLELRTDGRALVPADAPELAFDTATREAFGLRDPLLVLLETSHPDGVFNPASLRRLVELHGALAALDGVGPAHVKSLVSEVRPRVKPGTLDFRRFLEPFPDTPERMQWLRDDVEAVKLLTGTRVSADRRALALVVGTPVSRWERADGIDRARFARGVMQLARGFEDDSHRVFVAGAPAAEALLGDHLIADLRLLIPLALCGVAGCVWLGCRRLAGVTLVMGEVGACLLFTFGVMGWAGVPLYLATAILPVILTTIGLADEIHIVWQLQRELAQREESALARCMQAMTRPITWTSLTTAVGFLSFLAAPIEPVRMLGVFAAVGIGFCWLFSLCATPALLALLGAERLRHPRAPAAASAAARLARLRPAPVLAALAAASLLLGSGLLRLEVQDGWIAGFAPESPFRRATERIESHLHGTHVLRLHVAFPEPGALHVPDTLRALGRLEASLAALPGVGGVIGPHAQLSTFHDLYWAGRHGRRVPDDRADVDTLWREFERVRGRAERAALIDDDARRGVVTIFLQGSNYRDTERILAAARRSAERELAAARGDYRFAGDVAVSQAMIPAIVRSQLGSLAAALAGAWLCVAWLSRSPRRATLALAPTALAVLWVFGAMGWLAIPVGVATSTFCAISLGIGIDYAIHLLERIDRGDAPTLDERVRTALPQAAPAILADAAAVSLGFGVLVFSQVPANARLGALVVAALTAAALLSLLGLPAWLMRRGPAGTR